MDRQLPAASRRVFSALLAVALAGVHLVHHVAHGHRGHEERTTALTGIEAGHPLPAVEPGPCLLCLQPFSGLGTVPAADATPVPRTDRLAPRAAYASPVPLRLPSVTVDSRAPPTV